MGLLIKFDFDQLTEKELTQLTQRASAEQPDVLERVEKIVTDVKTNGDEALFRLSLELDKLAFSSLWFDSTQLEAAAGLVDDFSATALRKAYANIETYHRKQLNGSGRVQTSTGIWCWRERRPVERVGLYVPGGSAVLPSTLLMLGIPARLAGVHEMVVCSPPQADGQPNPYLAFVARLLGIDKVHHIGGAQAVAAMAFGTETIPAVHKIFGPGNQYVTQAKRLVQHQTKVAIDMPAGPSELLVIADHRASPAFIAADLLSQAEHGPDSQVVLLTTSREQIEQVLAELEKQVAVLPRSEIARKALLNSFVLFVSSLEDAFAFSNRYAPEHLIIALEDPEQYITQIISAGSVFLGDYAPESAGDYASGTNHTLPTSGFAHMYSGLSVDSFSKQISFQSITPQGLLDIGGTVEQLSSVEGLAAHGRAVSIRTDFLKSLS